MTAPAPLHGTCVALGDRGVIIVGASGTGKSTLAVQLIGLGAQLIADDRVTVDGTGRAQAPAPGPIRGLLEIRGLGLMRLTPQESARLVLAVDMAAENVSRLPQPRETLINTVCLPLIAGRNRPNLAYEIMSALRFGQEPLFQDPEQAADAKRS